jgi:hypothetical protein
LEAYNNLKVEKNQRYSNLKFYLTPGTTITCRYGIKTKVTAGLNKTINEGSVKSLLQIPNVFISRPIYRRTTRKMKKKTQNKTN